MSRLIARKLFIIFGLLFLIIGVFSGISIIISSFVWMAGKITLYQLFKFTLLIGVSGALLAGLGIVLIFVSIE